MKTYTGNIEITKNNTKEWEKKLAEIERIEGDVILDQGATFTAPVLAQSGYVRLYQGATFTAPVLAQSGYVILDTALSIEMEKVLWKAGKGKSWVMTNNSSDWMLKRQGDITYRINDVQFDKGLFNKIRSGKISASEVFAIPNMEQRRVAYGKMDKIKMKELEGFTVVHRIEDDGHQFPMQIVCFNLPGFNTPFYFLNCFCPSSGREYYIETREKDCWKAKAASFGLPADVEWVAEY